MMHACAHLSLHKVKPFQTAAQMICASVVLSLSVLLNDLIISSDLA